MDTTSVAMMVLGMGNLEGTRSLGSPGFSPQLALLPVLASLAARHDLGLGLDGRRTSRSRIDADNLRTLAGQPIGYALLELSDHDGELLVR